MTHPLIVGPGIELPSSELSWRFSRSSGPGGQSVNTADSRASLSFDLANSQVVPPYLRDRAMQRLANKLVAGVLTVHSEAERSQLQNRRACEDRLIELLDAAMAVPPASRRATKPSRSAQARRVSDKKQRGQTKRLRSVRDDD